MIDIETLSVNLQKDPVILTIGAVTFDKEGIKEKFKILVDIQDCLNQGCVVDGSTIECWLSQPEEARKSLNECSSTFYSLENRKYPLVVALYSLIRFMNENLNKDEEGNLDCRVWANSPIFDLSIIRKLFQRLSGCDVNWNFRQERDFRTFKDIVGAPLEYRLPSHDCLNDCINQAEHIIKHHLSKGE